MTVPRFGCVQMIFNLFKSRRVRERSLGQAKLLREQGKLESALEELQALIEQHPENPDILRELAEVHAELEQDVLAVETLCRLLAVDADEIRFVHFCTSFDAIRNLPVFRRVYQTLIDELSSKLEESPGEADLRFRLSEAYEMLDQADQALAIYREIVAEEQDAEICAQACYATARLHAISGEAAEAVEALKETVNHVPRYAETALHDPAFEPIQEALQQSQIELIAGRRQVELLAEAIQADPDNPFPYRQLIRRLIRQGDLALAGERLQEALRRFPHELMFREARADLLFEAEQNDEALREYEEILPMVGTNPRMTYRVGILYERLGNLTAASACFWDAASMGDVDLNLMLAIAAGFVRLGEEPGVFHALEAATEIALEMEAEEAAHLSEHLREDPAFADVREKPEFQRLLEALTGRGQE